AVGSVDLPPRGAYNASARRGPRAGSAEHFTDGEHAMSRLDAPPPNAQSRVSRRDFLRAAGSSTLLTAATAAAVTFEQSTAYAQQRWDREADVVAVGTGMAGSVAALFAHEGGA